MFLKGWRNLGVAALVAAFTAWGGPPALAETLSENVSGLLQNHKRILAAKADLAAAREQVRVSKGGWFPDLDVTAHYGYEKQFKPEGTDDTNYVSREVDFTLTQLLWDFNSTNRAIDRTRLTYEQSLTTLAASRQALIMEAITAHLTVSSAAQILAFARESEANIKHQTELEDARVRRGSGFSTDVLQAKTQLAGAQARRVQSQGALWNAQNRYRAVFGKPADDVEGLVKPRIPAELLPETLEEAVKITLRNNPQLKASLISGAIARATVDTTRSDSFFPVLNLIGDSKHKRDVGGTLGLKHEAMIRLEMTYNFDLGLTATNTLRATEQAYIATQHRYGDARDIIEEQARNAWQNLLTAKENAEFLSNQANIAGEFLELARKERKLGQRSLIDVLAGETALINASSDAAAAETGVTVAAFTLLFFMGQLELDVLE